MGRSYWVDISANSTYSVGILKDVTTFTYDGDGGRVKREVNGTPTIYVGLLFETSSSISTRHIFLGDTRIASVENAGGISYYHGDHLGSTSDVTNQNGDLIQHTEYTPYGEFSPSSAVTDERVTQYLFTGKLLDTSTNLYYYGARYYDPVLGRFTQADTIVPDPSDPQAFDRYGYARGNPIRYTDPTGHSFWDKVKKIFKEKVIPAAIAFTIGYVLSGFNPIAGAAAAITTLALDTGEGRQLINRVGHEFFDDVLGIRPKIAHAFSSITLHIAGTMLANAGLNAMIQPQGSTGSPGIEKEAAEKAGKGNLTLAGDELKTELGSVEGGKKGAEIIMEVTSPESPGRIVPQSSVGPPNYDFSANGGEKQIFDISTSLNIDVSETTISRLAIFGKNIKARGAWLAGKILYNAMPVISPYDLYGPPPGVKPSDYYDYNFDVRYELGDPSLT